MQKIIENQKYNHFTIEKFLGIINKKSKWLCVCDCGNKRELSQHQILKKVKSCGCQKNKNLINKKFNKLTAIELIKHNSKYHYSIYKFLCECGNYINSIGKRVEKGIIKDCGCDSSIKKGDVFGKLKVIDINNKKITLKCECGKIIEKSESNILRGNNKSCGCIRNLVKENQRYGKLLVIQQKGFDNNKHKKWLCVCDCGKTCIVAGYQLTTNNTKSCGCKRRTDSKNHKNWKGYKNISMTFFKSIMRGAKERLIDFNLSIEYISDLYDKQNGKCKFTKIEISTNNYNRTASLDRIDSKKGYIEGNVQWVHKDINRMKSNFTEQYFKELCRKVVANEL